MRHTAALAPLLLLLALLAAPASAAPNFEACIMAGANQLGEWNGWNSFGGMRVPTIGYPWWVWAPAAPPVAAGRRFPRGARPSGLPHQPP